MTTREFLTNVTIILTIMAAGTLFETIVPLFSAANAWRGRRSANLAFTGLSFLSNWLLASVAAILALSWRPAGLMAASTWPVWLQIVLSVVLLDFSVGYLSHRTLHMSSFLWRFHRIHHSDDFVDATTTYRTHPVETVWRFLFAVVPVWMLGIPAQAVVIQRLLQASFGVLEHSNVRLRPALDRLLSVVWVTPNVHKIHHSRVLAETNSNYANVLTLWDRLLGTYTPSERVYSVVYGLDDADPARGSFPALLAMPFEPAVGVSVPDTKVRNEESLAR
ncbi:MAG TPA: sterol desaturase family protein [Vicinamibacterales bacterium]|nr:sterol desaturase family protein [Vicinamibacterales bacterium]